MIVAALVLFIRPPNLDEALRSANLALRDDLADQNDYSSFYTSTQKYLQIIKSYGKVPEAELGLGRAYFGAGRYRAAASSYALAGTSKEAVIERRNANRYARITAYFERPEFKNRRVVRQMPWRRSDWLVLTANRKSADEGYGDRAIDGLRISVFNETSGRLRSTSVALSDHEYAIGATLNPIQLGRSSGFLLHLFYTAGNSSPNSYNIYQRRRDGIRQVGNFFGITASDVLSDGMTAPFEIGVAPSWKVYWKDRYRWTGSRFKYVRAGYPHVFGDAWKLDEHFYFSWVELACMRAAKRDWPGAAKALREAERVCKLAIQSGGGWESTYPDCEYFLGKASINLAEIRQRLRWIAKHDYNHILLYRPYDWDLQVPPYKLGHAGDNR